MRLRRLACLALAMSFIGAGPGAAIEREGLHNGSFELGLAAGGDRPRHWYAGFPGDDSTPPGDWALVEAPTGSGTVLELRSDAVDGFFLSQAVDLPAGTMAGVELRLTARVRLDGPGAWAGVQLIAVNPEVEPDPQTGIPEVAYLPLITTSHDWVDLDGSVTLSDAAEVIVVLAVAGGVGTVALVDEVSVRAEMPPRGCGPGRAEVPLLAGGRPSFPIGITNESTGNLSDAARTELINKSVQIVDLVNLFVHIRWNELTGRPLLDGHHDILAIADELKGYGIPRMLTFDFTHDNLEGLGDINPLPDGTPVGRLEDPGVIEAYLAELLAMAEALQPVIVSVGIETDFFWLAHADQWPDYRAMLCEAQHELQAALPGVHVTTYFTLPTLVRPDGSPNAAGQAAMRELEPCIDSVGYSTYPADGIHHLDALPGGFFTAAKGVAPELPLIVPEFGYRGGDAVYSEDEQEAFLRRALEELSGSPTVAVVWYSLYDQTYLGVEDFFKEAFSTIGLLRLDGTPKRSWVLLERIHNDGRFQRPGGAPPLLPCR